MSGDRWLGAAMLLFALVTMFVWVPLDTDSGIVDVVRRRARIGDALAPTVAACVILLGALITLFKGGTGTHGLTRDNALWLISLLIVFAVAIGTMRYLGPVLATVFEQEYRPLRDTAPWKYIGYVTGGTMMICALGLLAKGGSFGRFLILGLVASLAIALAYDLPFDDLLLPPNGDV